MLIPLSEVPIKVIFSFNLLSLETILVIKPSLIVKVKDAELFPFLTAIVLVKPAVLSEDLYLALIVPSPTVVPSSTVTDVPSITICGEESLAGPLNFKAPPVPAPKKVLIQKSIIRVLKYLKNDDKVEIVHFIGGG